MPYSEHRKWSNLAINWRTCARILFFSSVVMFSLYSVSLFWYLMVKTEETSLSGKPLWTSYRFIFNDSLFYTHFFFQPNSCWKRLSIHVIYDLIIHLCLCNPHKKQYKERIFLPIWFDGIRHHALFWFKSWF